MGEIVLTVINDHKSASQWSVFYLESSLVVVVITSSGK